MQPAPPKSSTFIFGSPLELRARARRAPSGQVRHPDRKEPNFSREEILRAGLAAVGDEQFRVGSWMDRIQRHMAGLLSPLETHPAHRRAPLEIALALSTPEMPQAYLLRSKLAKIQCAVCKAMINRGDVYMRGHNEPHPPKICLECVKGQAGISLPIEEAEAEALTWIEHRLGQLGRLPRE